MTIRSLVPLLVVWQVLSADHGFDVPTLEYLSRSLA